MSARSCSRSGSAARARCSSRSGLRPAFQASMKSLRMRSGSGGTEDLLQFLHTAAAALVDVVVRDAEAFGDRVAVELLDVRELEHLAVVVVAQAADGPVHERLGLLPALLLEVRVVGAGAQLRVVRGEGGVVRAAVAAVVPRRVEAAGGVLLVAELLAAEVQAREGHDAGHGRAELAGLALAGDRARASWPSPPPRKPAPIAMTRRYASEAALSASSRGSPGPLGKRKPRQRILIRSKLFSARRSQICAASASRPRSRATAYRRSRRWSGSL